MQPTENSLIQSVLEAEDQPRIIRPADIEASVRQIFSAYVEQEYRADKAVQNFRLREVDLYHRGIQHIAPVQTANGWDWQDATSDEEGQPVNDRSFNMVLAYGRKYVPAIGNRPWHNVKGVPERGDDELDRRAADSGQALAEFLKRKWNAIQMTYDLAGGFWTGGTQYILLFSVADAEMFGVVEEPQYEEQDVEVAPAHWACQNCGATFAEPLNGTCPECGVPVQPHWMMPAQMEKQLVEAPPKRYPRTGPVPVIVDGSIFTVPFDCRDIEKTPWAVYEVDDHPANLLALYGDNLRKEVGDALDTAKSNSGVDEDNTFTRAIFASLNGTPQHDSIRRWRHRLVWMRPQMYEMEPDAAIREELKRRYPTGLLAPFVNDIAMPVREDNIQDRIVAAKPEWSRFVWTNPYALSILDQQDVVNALMEMALTFQERKMPTLIADSGLGIADSINNRRGMPTEVIETMGKFGRSVADGVALIPTPQGDAGMYYESANQMRGIMEHLTSITPPIYGGMDKQPPTAEAARNLLNQAVQALSYAGNSIGMAFALALKKGVRLMARDNDRPFAIPNPEGASELADFEALREGRFDFEPHPGIPMSFAEKAQMLEKIITQSPAVAAALGLDQPLNVGVVFDYLLPGMKDIKVPMQEKRKFAMRRIRELLKAAPVPSPDGGMPQSSMQPDPFLDDHPFMAQTIVEWAQSEAGTKAATAMPEGYRNVLLHGEAQLAAAQPPLPGPMDEEGNPLPQGNAPADGGQGKEAAGAFAPAA